MPIDLNAELQKQQTTLDELLKQRKAGIPGDIQGIQNTVEGGRNLAAPVNQALVGVGVGGGAPQDQVQNQTNNLSRELAKQLSTTALNRGRKIQGYQGQEVNRRATQAQANTVQATGYANSQQALTQQEAAQAAQSELARQTAMANETMREMYQNAGIASDNAAYDAANSNTYEMALTRLLSGAAGSVGTAMLLRNRPKVLPQSSDTSAPSSSSDFIGPQYPQSSQDIISQPPSSSSDSTFNSSQPFDPSSIS